MALGVADHPMAVADGGSLIQNAPSRNDAVAVLALAQRLGLGSGGSRGGEAGKTSATAQHAYHLLSRAVNTIIVIRSEEETPIELNH